MRMIDGEAGGDIGSDFPYVFPTVFSSGVLGLDSWAILGITGFWR